MSAAVGRVVVAAGTGRELAADVATRRTAHRRRSAAVALAAVLHTATVERLVVAAARRRGRQRVSGSRRTSTRRRFGAGRVDSGLEVTADVDAGASRQLR